MKPKIDALDSRQYRTILYLKDDFVNIEMAISYKVTSPSGYTELFKQTLSKNCQHMKMWEDCGCIIKRIEDMRPVRGCNIGNVTLKQLAPDILEYTIVGKENANKQYNEVIKPGLEKKGAFIESHDCKVRPNEKSVPNCHEGTILDPGYSSDIIESVSS